MLTEQDPQDVDVGGVVAADRRRGGKRHRAVLLIGRASGAGTEVACLVHDISAGGMMARFAVPPVVGDRMTVTIRGLDPVEATVRWVRNRKAGLEFATPQIVERVFQPVGEDGLIVRAPRFALVRPALLRFGDKPLAARTIDVSAGGAKIATPWPIRVGDTGQLLLPDTGSSLYGRICWVRPSDAAGEAGIRCGFRFVTPLSLDALAHILAG
ncbi:PilZ domain-containing protein [Sphingomonas sp. Leaf343]|uniref:PilZ domain-containing protein n=1 Tax=Sphingomonas sp. Leaf343 TaxID=1736345 RepID=UPI0006FA1145|nr:PilZ domain-containing protein [Sphingomonas sp. Leaf343]KQR82206.1 hypothetical protein ASG07_11015 [Sphingomonas sp. Leaf343]